MRCLSCDCELTDFEATRRYENGGNFVDLCGRCLSSVVLDLDTMERFELFDPDVDVVEWETDTSPSPNSSNRNGESDED